MTKAQIDRMGERLKKGNTSDEDFHQLDQYRGSFAETIKSVTDIVREKFKMQPAARIKVTRSIIEKLRRGSTKLSQMQDIAGCRVIVEDIIAQEQTVELLRRNFTDVKMVDRRQRPSHGYRAVHAIIKLDGKWVEVQIRTILQHLWANLSEKVSDRIDPLLKYGKGPDWVQTHLMEMSREVIRMEAEEMPLVDRLKNVSPEYQWSEDLKNELRQARRDIRTQRHEMPWQFNRRFLDIIMELPFHKDKKEGV